MVNRRRFNQLAGLGLGAVWASALPGCAHPGAYGQSQNDFYFAQLSDCHWGYQGPANPMGDGALKQAVAAVNALSEPPDFIVFTGDLTHSTEDPAERRRRLREFQRVVKDLKVQDVHFMPGEHDAALDRGAAFQEFFGPTHYTFDHKGIHFIVLDNVSDAGAKLGDEQLQWLKTDLDAQAVDAPIVVFTHRPLFSLVPQWDWATRDGAQAIDLLLTHRHVTVFYGHIHQEHHHMTQHIAHHAAKSLIFPLPAPGSQDKRTPLPWDPAQPFRGLGWREVEAGHSELEIKEFPVVRA